MATKKPRTAPQEPPKAIKSKPKGKGPGGRPSKYRPSYCAALVEHMAQGYSFESFAGIVETTFQTLYNWEKIHPEFLEAKQKGWSKNRIFWEQAGIEGMATKGFNVAAWIFNMKNRHGWVDRQEIDDGPNRRGRYEELLDKINKLEQDGRGLGEDTGPAEGVDGTDLRYNGKGASLRH